MMSMTPIWIPFTLPAQSDKLLLGPAEQAELEAINDEEERQEYLAEFAKGCINAFDFEFDLDAAEPYVHKQTARPEGEPV
jgi:hypothetical protein